MRIVQEKAPSLHPLREIGLRVFRVLGGSVDNLTKTPPNLVRLVSSASVVRENLGAWTLAGVVSGAALVVLTGCPPGKQGPNQTSTSEASTTEIVPTTGIGNSTEPECSNEPTSNFPCSQMTTTTSPTNESDSDSASETGSITTTAESMTDPTTSPTTGMDTEGQCLEGIRCQNGGECKVIDGLEQCVCPEDSCYKGGGSNCFDECTDTCIDVSQPPNPAQPECEPCPQGFMSNSDPDNPQCIQNPLAPGEFSFDQGRLVFNKTNVTGKVSTPDLTFSAAGEIKCGDQPKTLMNCPYVAHSTDWECMVDIDLMMQAFANCEVTVYGIGEGGVLGLKKSKFFEITE